jgi:hypothetical protein
MSTPAVPVPGTPPILPFGDPPKPPSVDELLSGEETGSKQKNVLGKPRAGSNN